MQTIISIAAGGALGSVLRHLVGKASLAVLGAAFPYGTLLVNVIGSFAIGALVAAFAHVGNPSQELRAFLVVGLLGGFTTFSAFSLDVVTLYERGELATAVLYIALSLVLSLAGIIAGLSLVRSFVS